MSRGLFCEGQRNIALSGGMAVSFQCWWGYQRGEEIPIMPMIEELEGSGKWLFRWRSYLPLIFFVFVFASFGYFSYPFDSPFLDQLWELGCLLVGCFGQTIRALTASSVPRRTSGRNTEQQVAETLNTTGMYSIVRNPLYLGNFFLGLAVALFLRVWWLPIFYIPIFILYYERIIFAEEMFLRRKFGDAYVEWAARTPAFFPRISQWRRPELPLSFRTMIRREYQGFYGFVLSLFVLEQAVELYMGHGWHIDALWVWIMSFSTCFYLVTRFLHKKTNLFHVDGR